MIGFGGAAPSEDDRSAYRRGAEGKPAGAGSDFRPEFVSIMDIECVNSEFVFVLLVLGVLKQQLDFVMVFSQMPYCDM